MMKSLFLLVATLALCSVSGLPAQNGRIVGGLLAEAGQFPYLVSISEKDRHICGGFIYNARWIVTAASCLSGKLSTNLKVTAGQLSLVDKETTEQIFSISSIIPIDVYNSTGQLNDIALIRVSTDINLSNPADVTFAKYSEVDESALAGQVMGWGATFDGGLESINLHFADVAIDAAAATDCGDYVFGAEFKPATMVCAKATVGTACHFDEGSPLVQLDATLSEPVVVGIMSKTKTCDETSPAVYTRISVFYSWLFNTAGPQPSPQPGPAPATV